jgi:hypothetical protein
MAVTLAYRCRICGVDLSGEGAADTHLASNPTHLVEEVLYDPSVYTDLAQAPSSVKQINDELYAYDVSRSRWLSVNRTVAYFGYSSNTRNAWLKVYTGLQTASQYTGIPVPKAARITKCVIQRNVNGVSGTVRTSLDYSGTGIYTLAFATNDYYVSDLAVNVSVAAGSNLTVYYAAGTPVTTVQCWLELAWDGGA